MTASRHHHTASYAPLTGGSGSGAGGGGGGANRLTQTLRSISWPQRKLFLLVFLWTCVCLVVFKTSLLTSSAGASGPPPSVLAPEEPNYNYNHHHQHLKLAARSAASLKPTTLEAVVVQNNSPVPLASSSSPTLEIVAPELDNQHQLGVESSQPNVITSSSSSSVSPVPKSSIQTISESRWQQQPPTRGASVSSAAPTTRTVNNKSHQSDRESKLRHANHLNHGDQCHYHYPNLFDLKFNNIHWQKFVSQANGERYASFNASATTQQQQPATYYLYNAYYDDRWRGGLPSVRVLAMIDRVHPPPTNCLLWSSKLGKSNKLQPLVARAEFVYAWYPKWGNYEDGLLQPWIVTCKLPREHASLVPESVSLVDVPGVVLRTADTPPQERKRRDLEAAEIMPPSYSSSSSSSSPASSSHQHLLQATSPLVVSSTTTKTNNFVKTYDCGALGPISNNLPVFNRRPPPGAKREKFAVCVKGLDFPFDGPESRVSIRLVEWIEMLNLLGAKKIFLYELDVHENISKVLNYYQKRGLVELSPLTLPGNQPNLPEYQHLYLKQKLTSKRQNELIPYNDCLYRNLHSYEYLALLDIDEVIMPLKQGHTTWYDLMGEVERMSLSEQNYSRASYNVRNVYFFDDLSGPLGTTQASSGSPSTSDQEAAHSNELDGDDDSDDDRRPHRDSAERGIPHYLHMMSHVYRSKNYTEPGQYVKCFHNTDRVVSLHNHFPMNCFGQCTTYSIPLDLAHLQHYRKDCVGPLRQSCKNDFRLFTTRDTTIWRYKQRMIRRTTRVLNHLQLLDGNSNSGTTTPVGTARKASSDTSDSTRG